MCQLPEWPILNLSISKGCNSNQPLAATLHEHNLLLVRTGHSQDTGNTKCSSIEDTNNAGLYGRKNCVPMHALMKQTYLNKSLFIQVEMFIILYKSCKKHDNK